MARKEARDELCSMLEAKRSIIHVQFSSRNQNHPIWITDLLFCFGYFAARNRYVVPLLQYPNVSPKDVIDGICMWEYSFGSDGGLSLLGTSMLFFSFQEKPELIQHLRSPLG